jgi:predicted RNA-binding protein YlxR (DUF448 family)
LIRLVAASGSVAVDARQAAPGRGAYLHPERSCWEYALRRRALGRTLRLGSAGADHDQLLAELQAAVSSRDPA